MRQYLYPCGPMDFCLEQLATQSGGSLQASAANALDYITTGKAHGAYPEAFVEAINAAGASGRTEDPIDNTGLTRKGQKPGTGHVFHTQWGNDYPFSAESRWPTPAEVAAYLGNNMPILSGSAPTATTATLMAATASLVAPIQQLTKEQIMASHEPIVTRQQRERYQTALQVETQSMLAHVNFYRSKRGEARIAESQLTADQISRCQTSALMTAGLTKSPNHQYAVATPVATSHEAQYNAAERDYEFRQAQDAVVNTDAINTTRAYRLARYGTHAPKNTGQAASANVMNSEDLDINNPETFADAGANAERAVSATREFMRAKNSGRP